MKNILAVLFLLPLAGLCQKIKQNEFDRFIKQRKIETSVSNLKSASGTQLNASLQSVGPKFFVLLTGHGIGASTVGVDDQAIILLANDSTVTLRSIGIQSFEIVKDQNTYKHQYTITLPELERLSRHNAIGIRKYDFKGFVNIEIPQKKQAELKKLSSLLIKELVKEKIIYNELTVALEDVKKHVGDSVRVCGKIFSARYLQNNERKPTLLNVGAPYPNQLLTIVVYGDDRRNFDEAPETFYRDKDVCVTGKVELFYDKPQISIRSKDQIQVRDVPASVKK